MALLRYLGGIHGGFRFSARCGWVGAWGVAHDGSGSVSGYTYSAIPGPLRAPQAGPTAPTLAALGGAHDVCFDRLAMCDSWAAGTGRRAPVFSITTWAMRMVYEGVCRFRLLIDLLPPDARRAWP